MIVDEDKKKYASYIFDVKETVGGENVIFHLVEQWQMAARYEQIMTMIDMGHFSSEKYFGVITREFNKERICNAIEGRKRELERAKRDEDRLPANNRVMWNRERLKKEQELKILIPFLSEAVEIDGKKYKYQIRYLDKKDSGYECDLIIKL